MIHKSMTGYSMSMYSINHKWTVYSTNQYSYKVLQFVGVYWQIFTSKLLFTHCCLSLNLAGEDTKYSSNGLVDTGFASGYRGAGRSSEVERSLMVRWVVGSILHGVDPLSYFSFQPVLHDWCNKGRGMCYPVCGMVHIKEPLLLIDKSSLCGGSWFPFSLSEWSLTICLTPYNILRPRKTLKCFISNLFSELDTRIYVLPYSK